MVEKKHHAFNLGSTETVNCSKEETDFGQNVSWYITGSKIKSGGRIKLNGHYLEIKSVQLDDAGTYECRGVSNIRLYTIDVHSEFSLCLCCLLSQHYFRYSAPLLQTIVS